MGKYCYCYETIIGKLWISEEDDHIVEIKTTKPSSDFERTETKTIVLAAEQLAEYFAGKRSTFQLPLNPRGTDFQKKVWNALTHIPFGETKSYKQIAQDVGNDKAARAVGLANNKNPLMIVVPCHRVIGSNGNLVGYAGGLAMKEVLLNIEKLNLC